MSLDPVRLDLSPTSPHVHDSLGLSRLLEGNESLRLVHGDNSAALHLLSSSLTEQVALAYVDPPFLTERRHDSVTRTRTSTGIRRTSTAAFDDRWGGLRPYLEALRTRIGQLRETLMPSGSLVIHVDPKTSHYVKVMCDEIFGLENFASEIVWRYRRWPAKTPNFQRVHDVLLRYVKDSTVPPRFNQLYEPLAESTRRTWGSGKQRAVVGPDGRRIRSSTTDAPSPGVPMGDVWEIGIVAPVARERTGYPTQKPLALIRRLVAALTHPGDWVLDAYAGSGTTLIAASAMERRVIGLDESPEAIRVMQSRLESEGLDYTLDRVTARQLSKTRASARRMAG